MRAYIIVFSAAAIFAGCASEPTRDLPAPSQPRPPTAASPGVNLSGYPPGFRAGYADGCTSAGAAVKRDEPRFKTDSDYAQGWRDGNDICKRRK